jgi:hypothetical protein
MTSQEEDPYWYRRRCVQVVQSGLYGCFPVGLILILLYFTFHLPAFVMIADIVMIVLPVAVVVLCILLCDFFLFFQLLVTRPTIGSVALFAFLNIVNVAVNVI